MCVLDERPASGVPVTAARTPGRPQRMQQHLLREAQLDRGRRARGASVAGVALRRGSLAADLHVARADLGGTEHEENELKT